ncbi:MAG: dihydrolipoyl dehydrogenase [Dehalococcoidia bacterium]|nr:dihydrolipoyl dehydrogenase [Dehalococcoidia bacterium]
MEKYGVIVIGSGSGMVVVEEALSHGLKVALVDRGPTGGTCLNTGCIPSKMLIYAADRIIEAQDAKKLGVVADIKNIDFKFIMERMRKNISGYRDRMRKGLSEVENLDFYQGEAHFVQDYTLEVNSKTISGNKICIASGSRTSIPPIKGLNDVGYLTNETVLQLKERPKSIIIIGGGYIAVEYSHFFAAIGTKVTILEMASRLILSEEPAISELIKKKLSQRMEIHTNALVEEVKTKNGNCVVVAKDANTSEQKEFTAQKVLVAVGRRSNADVLKVEKTGVETDSRGYIKVDDYMETSKKNIFAVGDANGQQMFTHVANREAGVAANNILHDSKEKMNYGAAPHAVYSHPQIASVGLTEETAKKDHSILVGIAKYSEVAKGEAMMEEDSFAKAIVDKETKKILGFHIIGPNAPELIQEVIDTMEAGGTISNIMSGIHIHPALSELIQRTLANLEEV